MHGSTTLSGRSVWFGGIVSIRIGGRLLQSGKQHGGKPCRTVLSFNETPNFFEYSSSNPAPREYRINKKNRVGARRLITSRPVITTEFRRKECGLHLLPGREQAADSVYLFSGSAVRSAVQHRRSVQQCVTNTSLFPERFRAGCRRVQSLKRTVGPGSVFDIPAKPGVVKPGFF